MLLLFNERERESSGRIVVKRKHAKGQVAISIPSRDSMTVKETDRAVEGGPGHAAEQPSLRGASLRRRQRRSREVSGDGARAGVAPRPALLRLKSPPGKTDGPS